jgi:transcriptional regulator with XRE-family HTH domain
MRKFLCDRERLQIAMQLKFFRMTHKLSQGDFGKLVGLSRRQICYFENCEWNGISDERIIFIRDSINKKAI